MKFNELRQLVLTHTTFFSNMVLVIMSLSCLAYFLKIYLFKFFVCGKKMKH